MTTTAAPTVRVLVIEDNPGDARLIREMLVEVRNVQFAVECADRLKTGLARLDEGGVDVVLLDLSLPDGQGLETFTRVHDQAPAIPIVVLTGLDDETVALTAVHQGAQDFLVKGQVDSNQLALAMRYAIERKRLDEERSRLLDRERALREEAERLAAEQAAILRHIADAVLIADPTGRITYANEAAQRLMGFVVKNGEYTRTYTLLSPDGDLYEEDELPLIRAARQGDTTLAADLRVRRADGTEIYMQGDAAPVETEDGRRLGAVLSLRDVTAQRDLERQKDEFFSSISHDLRTPLAAIKASIGVVLANEPADLPPTLHRMLANVDRAADEMAHLIDDLLELTRLRAGRVQLQPIPYDLRDLVLRSARAIEPLAQERRQAVEVQVPNEPTVMNVDGGRLGRALMNLLGNAQKYGPPGGAIEVSLERHPDSLRIAVHDDGPGIPIDEQERIFERFYRARAESARRSPGSGLGLPIARAMVELHGGRIWVESAPEGGTTFWISLPVAAASPAAGAKDGVS